MRGLNFQFFLRLVFYAELFENLFKLVSEFRRGGGVTDSIISLFGGTALESKAIAWMRVRRSSTAVKMGGRRRAFGCTGR